MTRATSIAIAAAALLWPAVHSAPARAADSALGPIVAQERAPLAFLVSSPTGETANTSSSAGTGRSHARREGPISRANPGRGQTPGAARPGLRSAECS